jgi:hypothetical protein
VVDASIVPVTILLRLGVRCKVGDIGVKMRLEDMPGGGDPPPERPPLLEGRCDGMFVDVGDIRGDSSSICAALLRLFFRSKSSAPVGLSIECTLASVLEYRLSDSLLASELGRGGGRSGGGPVSYGRSELMEERALPAKLEPLLRVIPDRGGRAGWGPWLAISLDSRCVYGLYHLESDWGAGERNSKGF